MHEYDNNSKPNETNTKEWIYGVLLPFPAKVIMKAIYEVLNQMNTVIFFYITLENKLNRS